MNDVKKTNIIIKGTHCQACKTLIEDISSEVPGVISCKVNYKTGETNITHSQDFDPQLFKSLIEEIGEYTVIIR